MYSRSNHSVVIILVILMAVVLAALVYVGLTWVGDTIRQSTEHAVAPVEQVNNDLRTQIAHVVGNPTPTLIPDPITVIHEMRSLARLETIQYTIEKVITAESGQGPLGFLFGDRLLLVAHGRVIAGTDMSKVGGQDIIRDGTVLKMRLPEPEIFSATLDNEKTYIFDRTTSVLTKGDPRLETLARQAAEAEIRSAALKDGILEQARINAENYLSRMLRHLGYPEVLFIYGSTPTPTPTPAR